MAREGRERLHCIKPGGIEGRDSPSRYSRKRKVFASVRACLAFAPTPDCKRDRERAGRGTKGGPARRGAAGGGGGERRRYVDRGEEEVNRRVRASASMRYGQTKNDEPRWGPDGGQKHATGPKAQALRAPRLNDSPSLFLLFPSPSSSAAAAAAAASLLFAQERATRRDARACVCARTLRRVHRTGASASASSDARRGKRGVLSERGGTANEEQSGIMKVMQSERMLMYAPADRDLHECAL